MTSSKTPWTGIRLTSFVYHGLLIDSTIPTESEIKAPLLEQGRFGQESALPQAVTLLQKKEYIKTKKEFVLEI